MNKSKTEIMQAYETCDNKEDFENAMHEIGELSNQMIEVVKKARKRMIAKGLLEASDEDL